MLISYLVATSAFAKGVALSFAAMAAAKACKNRQNGDKRRSSGQTLNSAAHLWAGVA